MQTQLWPVDLSPPPHVSHAPQTPLAPLSSLRRLMDSLNIFSELPVDPNAFYLVGLQVLGVPGFDFLSPIGTSGVTIAAALNPCVGKRVGWMRGRVGEGPGA